MSLYHGRPYSWLWRKSKCALGSSLAAGFGAPAVGFPIATSFAASKPSDRASVCPPSLFPQQSQKFEQLRMKASDCTASPKQTSSMPLQHVKLWDASPPHLVRLSSRLLQPQVSFQTIILEILFKFLEVQIMDTNKWPVGFCFNSLLAQLSWQLFFLPRRRTSGFFRLFQDDETVCVGWEHAQIQYTLRAIESKKLSQNIVGFLLSDFFGRDEVLPQFYLMKVSNKNVCVCVRVIFFRNVHGSDVEVDGGWDGDDDAGTVCNQALTYNSGPQKPSL